MYNGETKMRPKDVNPGVRNMAQKLLELVWHREMVLERGPKSISTARINLGSTEVFFDKVLEFALEQGMVYKVANDLLSIYPPDGVEPLQQLKLEDVEQIYGLHGTQRIN